VVASVYAAVRNPEVPGNRRWTIYDFTFSDSYPEGGEPMTASLFGMTKVDAVVPMGAPLDAAHCVVAYIPASNTLALYTTSTGAVVATGSDQKLKTVRILVLGI
jgi:hypothetical protein